MDKEDVAEVNADGARAIDTLLTWISQPAKHPTLIRRTALAQLWHKKDDQFWMPKADVRIAIKKFVPAALAPPPFPCLDSLSDFCYSPLAYASARHATMSR